MGALPGEVGTPWSALVLVADVLQRREDATEEKTAPTCRSTPRADRGQTQPAPPERLISLVHLQQRLVINSSTGTLLAYELHFQKLPTGQRWTGQLMNARLWPWITGKRNYLDGCAPGGAVMQTHDSHERHVTLMPDQQRRGVGAAGFHIADPAHDLMAAGLSAARARKRATAR